VTVDPTLPPQKLYSAYGWRAARSAHPSGVNVLYADGSSRFLQDDLELALWRKLSTRDSGEDGNAEQ
jgi:prepilin-type processing-associated H-X9-DG protein